MYSMWWYVLWCKDKKEFPKSLSNILNKIFGNVLYETLIVIKINDYSWSVITLDSIQS